MRWAFVSGSRHEDVGVEDDSHELLRPALAPYGLNRPYAMNLGRALNLVMV